MPRELLEPVVDAGVRLTNFFNGRVLTAEDLRREQEASAERHRGLASAVGEGVVHGLEVRVGNPALPTPTVWVTAGIGFNRNGDPVRLASEVEVRLIPAEAEQAATAGEFGLCERPAVEVEISNPGFYILIARPASQLSSDRVAAVELDSQGVGTRCGSRYSEEGVSFALVPLPLPAATPGSPLPATIAQLAAAVDTDLKIAQRGDTTDSALPLRLAQNLSKLRSGMAFWCSGYDSPGERIRAMAVALPTPGAPPASLSPLDALRASGRLAPTDLPLALLHVSLRQLESVDVWTVRRHPTPRLGPDPLPLVSETRPASDVAALVLQFRDHASMFLSRVEGSPIPPPEQVSVPDWFLYLPPVCILPLAGEGAVGFDPGTFFPWSWWGEKRHAPIEKRRFEPLLRLAMRNAPVRLGEENDEFITIHLYRFSTDGDTTDWENRYAMCLAEPRVDWND